MDTRQQHGEPERREGLGGRVRRFVDSELSRVLDKKEDRVVNRNLTDHGRAPDSATESERAPDSHRAAECDQRQEPLHAGEPAHIDSSTTTARVDPGYDFRVKDAGSEEVGARSTDQTAADGSAQRVGLLDDPAGLRDEWQRVQGTFVDDPQSAVHEASALVDRTLREIHNNVTRGQTSDPISTEDLRVSFQRYREFFQRLLSA